jgi:hypothetical protein
MTESAHDPIAALSDEQAAKAARIFFDRVPPECWEDGRKPSGERVRTAVEAIREEAGETERSFIEQVLQPTAARGVVARLVLAEALASAALRPHAETALAEAVKPDMMFDAATGLFVIVLLLCTSRVEKTPSGFKVELGAGAKDIIAALRVPELLDKLPAIIKALPAEVVAAVLSGV